MKYTYSNLSVPAHKVATAEMLERLYPKFDEEKQCVLWLICDFGCMNEIIYADANIKIIFNNNTSLELPFETKVRKPYPNKMYHHLCFKGPRNRNIYGLPLVFDNFEDMKRISKIRITWNLFGPRENNVLKKKLIDTCAIIDYNIQFNCKSKTSHWYTLNTIDKSFIDFPEFSEEHDNEYDIMLEAHGFYYLDWDGNGNTGDILHVEEDEFGIGVPDEWFSYYDEESSPVSKNDVYDAYLTMMEYRPSFKQIEYAIKKLDRELDIGEVIQYQKCYYQGSVTIQSEQYADLLSEPSYGFKNTINNK